MIEGCILGSGSGTPVLFANGLGTTYKIWKPYVERWQAERRLLCFDLPGHGNASSPAKPIAMEDLADDAVALMDRHGVERAHVVGVSMGGMIAQSLGARVPERVASLTMASVGARTGTREFWQERAEAVRVSGLADLAVAMPSRWFSPEFVATQRVVVDEVVAGMRTCDRAGYAACCEAIGGFDGAELAGAIKSPVLVVGGAVDPVSGPAVTRDLAERIPGARYELLPGASHLLTMEQPEAVARLVGELVALAE